MQTLKGICEKYNMHCSTLPENKLQVQADTLSFTAMRIDSSYILQGIICSMPSKKQEKEQLCTRLAQLQLVRLKHELELPPLAALSLQENHCYLQTRIPLGLRESELYSYLENFCNALDTWKNLAKPVEKASSLFSQNARFISPNMMG